VVTQTSVARELGIRMCEAWGLNPAEVLSIEIEWSPENLPVATVRLFVNEAVVYELLTLAPVER
jgi:hypothetical protein